MVEIVVDNSLRLVLDSSHNLFMSTNRHRKRKIAAAHSDGRDADNHSISAAGEHLDK
jgi:hypothetical protein